MQRFRGFYRTDHSYPSLFIVHGSAHPIWRVFVCGQATRVTNITTVIVVNLMPFLKGLESAFIGASTAATSGNNTMSA